MSFNKMKYVILLWLSLLSIAATSQTTTYELRKVMSANPDRADYSYWEFPSKSFAKDTVFYGESITFMVYVDPNKHEAITPMLGITADYQSPYDSVSFAYDFTRFLTTVALPEAPQPFYLDNIGEELHVESGGLFYLNNLLVRWKQQSISMSVTARGLLCALVLTPTTPGSWILVKSIRFYLTVGFSLDGFNMPDS